MIVGGRRDLRAAPHRPGPGPGAVRHRFPGRLVGQHGQPPAAQRRPHLGAGRLPERVQHGGRIAVEQVVGVVVVHGHGAARSQVGPGLLDRLQGEQVALQPQVGLPVDRGQRVGQGEQDQVVVLLGVLQEGPAVSIVRGHPGTVVRVIGVLAAAELEQHRVDLDRVHVPGALGQGHRDIIAGACPDDQDVLQRRPGHVLVRVEIELLLLVQHGQRAGRLVGDVVRRHVQRGVRLAAELCGNLVVRGPLLVRNRRLDGQHDHHDGGGRVLPPPRRPPQQQGQAACRDHAPGDRGQFQERQQGERGGAGDAAEHVQPVGLERLERHEEAGHGLPEAGHHRGGKHEHRLARLTGRGSAWVPNRP